MVDAGSRVSAHPQIACVVVGSYHDNGERILQVILPPQKRTVLRARLRRVDLWLLESSIDADDILCWCGVELEEIRFPDRASRGIQVGDDLWCAFHAQVKVGPQRVRDDGQILACENSADYGGGVQTRDVDVGPGQDGCGQLR